MIWIEYLARFAPASVTQTPEPSVWSPWRAHVPPLGNATGAGGGGAAGARVTRSV